MTNVIFRRKGLGRDTCTGIAAFMSNPVSVVVNGVGTQPTAVRNLVRWGCTAAFRGLRLSGQCINSAQDITRASHKGHFRAVLNHLNICPYTSTDPNQFSQERAPHGAIVRPNRHAQGKDTVLCLNKDAIDSVMRDHKYDAYWSAYIPKVKEYRVFLANRGVLCMIEKVPANPEHIAWNHAQGAEIPNIRWRDWPMGAVRVAEIAARASGLDFCGVDVIEDDRGAFYVLEINSAPTLSEYRQEKFAKVFDYMIDNPDVYPERFPVGESLESWEQCIHPAVMKKPESIQSRGY